MKRHVLQRHGLLAAAVLLGGCAASGTGMAPQAPARTAVTPSSDVVTIQRPPFVLGVSSYTVEALGRSQGCASERGASLVTEPGPVEVYRVMCDDGAVFVARCELRECRKM